MASATYHTRATYFHSPAGSGYFSESEPDSPVVLSEPELTRELHALGNAQTITFNALRGWRAHSVSFQPTLDARSQDRLVTKQLDVHGQMWTMYAVFDGHLGEDTVEHTAYHLPIIVEDFLQKAVDPQRGWLSTSSAVIKDVLQRAISSFDDAIAGDIVNLFPGGLKKLASLPDAEISKILNDGGPNFKKARLCLYGTTALVTLVDPTHEHLWCANLGDSQAVLVTFDSTGQPRGEPLSAAHNGTNACEVNRVRAEHPGEPEAVRDGRVLGVIGPFRCIGDTPFKLEPVFTRKVLYNLSGCGVQARAQWDMFLARSHTPPYISAQADVTYRHLSSAGAKHKPLLVLCTDGLVDLCGEMSMQEMVDEWSRTLGNAINADNAAPRCANLAIALLRHVLGGDAATVSRVLSYDLEVDDTTIVVATL